MSTSTFTPMQEHLGDVIKSTNDANNALEGFTKSYKAAYTALSSVKQPEVAPYSWSAANLFAGVNADSFEALTDTRDVLVVIQTVIDGIVKALEILDSIVAAYINSPTQLLLTALEALIDKIVDLFNPTARLHLLYIPPKIGDLSDTMLTAPNGEDTVLDKFNRSSAIARNALVDNLNTTLAFLPTALKTPIENFKSFNEDSYGSKYLLNTINRKLDDKFDKNRPYLDEDSYWAGFGIFLGSSLPNKTLSYWDQLNGILDASSKIRLPSNPAVPPRPAIQKHKVTELSRLLSPIPTQTEMSAIQESIVCYPLGPTTHYSNTTTFNFSNRLIYFSRATIAEEDLDKKSPTDLLVAIQKSIDTDTILTQLYAEASTNSEEDFILFSRDTSIIEHLPTVESSCYRFLLAVDVYYVEYFYLNQTRKHYVNRFSDPVTCLIHPRGPSGFVNVDYTSENPLTSSSISGTFPNWYSVGTVLNILPNAIGQVVNFLDLLRTYIQAFSDTVLNKITVMLTNLKNYLTFINRIIARVDELVRLLNNLASITTSLGASVVVFDGEGSTKNISSLFKEYLDSTEERKNSFSQVLNEYPEKEPIAVTFDELVDAVTTDVSSIDKINENYSSYIRELELEADLKFSEQRKIVPRQTSDASFYTGKKSPVFTDKDTTCGIVAIATASSVGDLLGIKSLIDLLFEDAEPKVQSPAEVLSSAGLAVDTTIVLPETVYVSENNPVALFTENMELTLDPEESPFNFCE